MRQKGSIYKPAGKRGFLSGAFLLKKHPFYSKNLEVIYREIKPKDKPNRHYHKKTEEFLIVLSGEYQEKVNGKKVVLRKGDFIFLKPKMKTEFLGAKKGTKVICIKTPSLPKQKDKYCY